MPRFYVDVHDGFTAEDHEGSDLKDLDAALSEARRSARELWAEGIRRGEDRRHWAIEIKDETERVVGTVFLEETARRV